MEGYLKKMEMLKKKVLKYIKQHTNKLDMQLGFAFLDHKALKKLNVTGEQLKEMFGETKVEPTDNNTGFNIHWKM